jgi:hypothetical protein
MNSARINEIADTGQRRLAMQASNARTKAIANAHGDSTPIAVCVRSRLDRNILDRSIRRCHQ